MCGGVFLGGDAWSKEDCLTLLERIRSVLPDGDTLKYKTTESHFDWEKVGFGNFTGDMCKQKWQKVSTEVSRLIIWVCVDVRVHARHGKVRLITRWLRICFQHECSMVFYRTL